MGGGGVDDRCLAAVFHCQVVAVTVVVDEDRGDRLGLGLPGSGVGGEDLVAGPEAGDGDGGAGGEENPGAGGEGLPAAGPGRVLPDSGVFGCVFWGNAGRDSGALTPRPSAVGSRLVLAHQRSSDRDAHQYYRSEE